MTKSNVERDNLEADWFPPGSELYQGSPQNEPHSTSSSISIGRRPQGQNAITPRKK